jgi:malonyl CoA-acyl carrier protein transacylase
MSVRQRVLVVCPGRGSYQRASLGQLAGRSGAAKRVVEACDAYRRGQGRVPVSELDAASVFRSRDHVAGENASLLTFACGMADLAELDRTRYELVGVTGNSLGFYTALAASGALELESAIELVDTMGQLQRAKVVGGQLLYPLLDAQWRADPALAAAVESALEAANTGGAYAQWSIRLGGTAVLGADEAGLRALEANLPPIERGERRFPLRLPLHSAFHTSVMAKTSERAIAELGGLEFRAPAIPLIDGRGDVHRPRWADGERLRDYTFGEQITQTFDFSQALRTAVAHCAPDLLVCLGPGNAMGGPVAQLLVQLGWQGVRSREAFVERNAHEPMLASFGVPAQAALLRQL